MDLIYDKHFLKQLDEQQTREIYAKLTLLSFDDKPLQQIEGKVSTGSVNVDGKSAVRRTCQLSLITPLDGIDIDDTYWCFNSKFKLEIGLRNYVNNKYPDIIWFEMGVYLIATFSMNKSTNNITLSISGKDKMCRLNGEMGGNMPAQWDWGEEEIWDYENGIVNFEKIPIKTIIYNSVRQFAQEPVENIIIKDLDTYGYELWEYLGDEPMYYLRDVETHNFKYMTFDNNIKIIYTNLYGDEEVCSIAQLEARGGKYYSTNTLDPLYNNTASRVKLADGNGEKEYQIIRIQQDETAGYHQIPITYNADLILAAGETVTSMLDKITKMLGNYEYFYNTKGQFVFQKKNDYIQELFATSSGALTTPMVYNDIYSYRFENEQLFTSIGTNPNIGNIKNDFSVWGKSTLTNYPIHARCALDKKPTSYVSPWPRYYRVGDLLNEGIASSVFGYYFKEDGEYVVQKSYANTKTKTETYGSGDNAIEATRTLETSVVVELNKIIGVNEKTEIGHWKQENLYSHNDYDFIPKGIIGFGWVEGKIYYNPNEETSKQISVELRLIINELNINKIITSVVYPNNSNYFSTKQVITEAEQRGWYIYVGLAGNRQYTSESYDWRELIYQMAIDFRAHGTKPDYYIILEQYNPQYVNGKTGYEQYYIDLEGYWRQLYNPNPTLDSKQYGEYYEIDTEKPFWNKYIHSDPNMLNFWFEFFDTQGELSKYSTYCIGARPKVVNETTVTSIYNKEAPEIQFIVSGSEEVKEHSTAYIPMQITENDMDLFYRSSQGNSAIGRINELMYNHLCLLENENITSVPIYYLQPNTRIYIKDKGDYTINKLSYNLSYNGTMNITASKIYKEFY